MGRSDFMLTPQELRHRQRKQRRRLVIIGSILLLAGIAVLVARPVRNAVRGWQARRHAANALAFIDQEKWREARDEASAAYRLRTTEPSALRAVARLLSRAGQVDGLEFWRQLDAVAPLNPDDLREEANLALQTNDLAAASEAVRRLFKHDKTKPTAADWLLAADIWGRKREYDKAVDFAQKTLADSRATRREQLQAILILENVMRNGSAALVKEPKEVDTKLGSLAGGNDDVALEALLVLTQYALASPLDPNN